jgi:uncharacterized membrane protein
MLEITPVIKNFVKFATLGVTTEIVFTASVAAIHSIKKDEKINWSLMGFSYIWMIPIYGSAAFLAPLLLPHLEAFSLPLRMLIYGITILIVEYITGFVIRAITGRCPWHYESKWSVHNLIRLDFLPLWMLFGLVIEFFYLYF